VDRGLELDVAPDLVDVEVGVVLEVLGQAVVLLDDGVEELGEVLVGVGIAGVDAAVLVVELNGASDRLGSMVKTRVGWGKNCQKDDQFFNFSTVI
jgi:hypothetical protein